MKLILRQLASHLFAATLLQSANADSQVRDSPDAGELYPANVYWGDTHLHTNLSADAYALGNRRLGPEDAYKFAKGGAVMGHNGTWARLRRPLDFLVIADHAENLGVLASLDAADPRILKTERGRAFYNQLRESQRHVSDKRLIRNVLLQFVNQTLLIENVDSAYSSWIWDRVTRLADTQYEPGKFTTLIGFEWTSSGPSTGSLRKSLHRVVIFRDGADTAARVLPFSSIDSSDPVALWEYLAAYRQSTGGDALAIPHNGNLSNGGMFEVLDFQGRAFSSSYAQTRSSWEPVVEVTQTKGDSETHPILSPTDEFADFERWDSLAGKGLMAGAPWNEAEQKKKQFEYVRYALRRGLAEQRRLGVNPFKFGLIGSTDAHTSLSTADENNFWGYKGDKEPAPTRMISGFGTTGWGWEIGAAGMAGVWAKENTREAIFDAMKRKEVFATTGPRISVRFFGGWNFVAEDAMRPDLARIGYRKGVPMGGDLTGPRNNGKPTFLVRAVKDPDGANLDRLQIIKGWLDKQGETHESIYDVAPTDARRPRQNGRLPTVGSSVDVADASYSNSIGDPELAASWTDPDFDPENPAFYYARVIEIPTPRWTAYDAKYFDLKTYPAESPMTIQERAYSSPIWYTP